MAAPPSPPAAVVVPDHGLYEKPVPVKGRGVFPAKPIARGQLVLRFVGPVYTRETCPEFSEAIQVGVNAWMHSSGGLDDLVNHACDPNCGLWQVGGDTFLIALRDIAAHEELSFDYSSSMVDEPWQMDGCGCGTALCRGVIANFLDMPPDARARYAASGALPEHVWVTAKARGVRLVREGTLDAVAAVPANKADAAE